MPTLDAAAIRTEIAETETDLVLAIQEAEGSALSIPGFEAVLAVTAVKIVIPVVAGLVAGTGAGDSAGGRRLPRVRQRRDIDQAVAALATLVASGRQPDPAGATAPAPRGPTPGPTGGPTGASMDQLRRDVVAVIVADGIDAQPADAVVTRTIARIHTRYPAAAGQPLGPPAT